MQSITTEASVLSPLCDRFRLNNCPSLRHETKLVEMRRNQRIKIYENIDINEIVMAAKTMMIRKASSGMAITTIITMAITTIITMAIEMAIATRMIDKGNGNGNHNDNDNDNGFRGTIHRLHDVGA